MKLLFVFDVTDTHRHRSVVLVTGDDRGQAYRTLVNEFAAVHLEDASKIEYRSSITISRMASGTKPIIEGYFS